ncbi:hypothetical protein [Nocardiopsis sp. LOL_012]|uniref:hypothetical protein n=1 Tax=Nocardiopsis sp. LOL_012 TaxID=3345409 RepID=UPI003A852327
MNTIDLTTDNFDESISASDDVILVDIAGGTGGAVLRLDAGDGGAEDRFLPQRAGLTPARPHRSCEWVSVDDLALPGDGSRLTSAPGGRPVHRTD